MVRSRMNHPVRVQSTRTPPPGEGNIQVFNKGWDKIVLCSYAEIYLVNKGRNKISKRKNTRTQTIRNHLNKKNRTFSSPEVFLNLPFPVSHSQKKNRVFPSLGGVSVAPADDGVVIDAVKTSRVILPPLHNFLFLF